MQKYPTENEIEKQTFLLDEKQKRDTHARENE